jgi:Na+/melibiose symporter-like transporter
MQEPDNPPPITEGPYVPPAVNPWYSWGVLVIMLGLLARSMSYTRPGAESGLEAHSLVAMPMMLLFNHLAYAFRWKRWWLSIAFKILAWSWIVIGAIWIEWSARQWRERAAQQNRTSAASVSREISC